MDFQLQTYPWYLRYLCLCSRYPSSIELKLRFCPITPKLLIQILLGVIHICMFVIFSWTRHFNSIVSVNPPESGYQSMLWVNRGRIWMYAPVFWASLLWFDCTLTFYFKLEAGQDLNLLMAHNPKNLLFVDWIHTKP